MIQINKEYFTQKKKKVWQGLSGKVMTEAQNIEQGFTIHKQVTQAVILEFQRPFETVKKTNGRL